MNYIAIIVLFLISSDWVFASNTQSNDTGVSHGVSFLSKILSTDALVNFAFGILVLVATFLVSKILSGKLESYYTSYNKDGDQTKEWLYGVISRSINITVWFLWITLMFGVMGLNVGLFLWWIGFWIWFTMQIFLSNFIYWIVMVTQGTVRNGDLIELNVEVSKVEKVNPLFTEVKKLNGVKSFIPNIKFLQDSFSNLYINETRRFEVEFTLDYTADIPKAKLIIDKVIASVPGVIEKPEHKIWLTGLSENGVVIKVLFRMKSRDKVFTIRSNVIETLNLAFKQAWILVAFNQMTFVQRDDIQSDKYKEKK